jgi:ribosomal protein S18 acetylase RimI-like enzyme
VIAGAVREDVVLRDGSTLRLRPTTADDERPLVAFFGRLSAESLHLRFQGAVRTDSHLVAPFLGGDGRESLSLVGELVDERGSTRIVGIGTFVRLRDPSRAEVAFAVADDMQRRGIGSRLLERLAVHARQEGVDRFVAQVLPENLAMLGVFGDTGFEVTRRHVEGVVEVEFELTPRWCSTGSPSGTILLSPLRSHGSSSLPRSP